MPPKKVKLVEISFHADDLILGGTLHMPANDHPPVVIGSHGLYSSRQSPKQIALARACNALDMAYFRFDHRGCGSSQGEFERVTSLATRCTDLKMAVAAIKNRPETGPGIGLFGSSMGGTVCLSVASMLEVNTVVTVAAPLCSRIDDMRPRRTKKHDTPDIFLDADKRKFNISEAVLQVNNILIFHGQRDETVPLSHAEEIHRLAGDPKKLIVLKNGDHRMSDEIHQNEFIREASRWFKAGLAGN
jgi:alpha-beta hydrolase superfamily lysophospholipase